MIYAAVHWIEDVGEDVEHMHLQVLQALTDSHCDRQISPLHDNTRYILARLPSRTDLDTLIVLLTPLALTFVATVSEFGEPFGCSPAPRIDRRACERVTG